LLLRMQDGLREAGHRVTSPINLTLFHVRYPDGAVSPIIRPEIVLFLSEKRAFLRLPRRGGLRTNLRPER